MLLKKALWGQPSRLPKMIQLGLGQAQPEQYYKL